MPGKLVWGIVGGVIIGAALGAAMGDTPIGIAICIALGAVAAYLWHLEEKRRLHKR